MRTISRARTPVRGGCTRHHSGQRPETGPPVGGRSGAYLYNSV